jgi:hypothetical protein
MAHGLRVQSNGLRILLARTLRLQAWGLPSLLATLVTPVLKRAPSSAAHEPEKVGDLPSG